MLDKETLDAIVAAVTTAVEPLAAEVGRLKAGLTLSAATINRQGRARDVPDTTMTILASKGVDIPFRADGTISTHEIVQAMQRAGLTPYEQTFIKTSLFTSGHVFVR